MYQSRNFLEANAKCPFYICEFKKTVTCEGFADGIESTLTSFESEEKKSDFVRGYCMSCYKNCKVYKSIMDKYPE